MNKYKVYIHIYSVIIKGESKAQRSTLLRFPYYSEITYVFIYNHIKILYSYKKTITIYCNEYLESKYWKEEIDI